VTAMAFTILANLCTGRPPVMWAFPYSSPEGIHAMRNLILQMQVSVDGHVGRADEGPGWQVWNWGPECPWDEPLKARFNAVFRDVDTILLSRKILEGGYVDHWSQFARDYGDNPDFAFAQRIIDARKVVFSRTLQMTKWAGTELVDRILDLPRFRGEVRAWD
jgi:hypothetical protein